MKIHLQFLGAAGTVTGSKTLLHIDNASYLIDCGLFQGLKKRRLLNWRKLPLTESSLRAVLLTHAHIDHSGYLPVLIQHGFKEKIFSTPATKALCDILLPDAAYLQEEDAKFANKHGFSKHQPALPLFTHEDAEATLALFKTVEWEKTLELQENLTATWFEAGHILGASFIQLNISGTRVLFSGDLGRMDCPVMHPPHTPPETDYLILESTYGNRKHPEDDPLLALQKIIDRTLKRGGSVVIPSFAVGRSQQMLYYIHQLKLSGKLAKDVPVYLDSPMATKATKLFCDFHDAQALTQEECMNMVREVTFVSTQEESKKINNPEKPSIIISASGMATGGRVVHHLKFLAPDEKNTILFIGFQAPGTRGEALLHGAKHIKIHGEQIPVRAEIASIESLSAHADQDEIMTWLRSFPKAPKMTFLNHGEDESRKALKEKIEQELHWKVSIPEDLEEISLQD